MKQNSIIQPSENSIILEQLEYDLNASCKEWGQNHGYRPAFEGVKTSMDIIQELIKFIEMSTTVAQRNDREN